MAKGPNQLVRARWVLPLHGPPLENGLLELQDGRIVAVRESSGGDFTEDLGDVVLMPGLVNVHTHLEFSELERPIQQTDFAEWIRAVIEHRRAKLNTPADVARAIEDGIRQSISFGVTTLGEISTGNSSSDHYDSLPSGSVVFREVIGLAAEDESARLAELDQFLTAADGRGWQAGISPHAPYTLADSLFSELVQRASQDKCATAVHLAETSEEVQYLEDRTGPLRDLLESVGAWRESAHQSHTFLDYLQSLSQLERVLVVHGNCLGPEEWDVAASHRDSMTMVYCPRTHLHFGHPDYRLAERLTAGVRVAIATDSRASSPDLDLLAELRAAHQLSPKVSAEQILRMGTVEAAYALGLSGEVGQLVSDGRANVIAVAVEPTSVSQLPEAILADAAQVVAVMIDGRWVRELV